MCNNAHADGNKDSHARQADEIDPASIELKTFKIAP